MDKELSEVEFSNIKKQVLNNIDYSKKGSVDTPILKLLTALNESGNFVSTSSCSGRIIITSQNLESENRKKNCHWVFSSHDFVDEKAFLSSLQDVTGHLLLKFEPFILHVQARTLNSAKALLNVGLSSGFRNSGIVLGKRGKIIVAIRSTSNLEVPLSDGDKLIVDDNFLKNCIKILNEKLTKNFESINRFENTLIEYLSSLSP